MRARNLFFALAALSIFAACNHEEDTPKVQDTLTVSGAKDNAITVAGAGKTVKLTVKSNLSWTASCDADWIEIDPASVENTDNKVVSTKVSVVVKKNEGKEDRSAEIKVGAEGVDPVVITVKQSAEVAEESVLCVWDMDKFVPFENPSISTDFYAAEISFVVHANVDWTATCPSWITLDPTSNKYDGQTQNVTVKAVVAVNDEEGAREGEIKFVGEGVADLVIPVKQAKAARVKLALKETEHPYTDVDFEVVPDEGITWTAQNFDDDEIAYLAENKLTPADFLIYQLNYFLQQGRTVSEITDALITSGNDTENVTGLEAETHYQFVVIGAVYDKDYQQFIPTTLPTYIEYTTAKAPVAEDAYAALAGTYEMKVFDDFDKKDYTLQMVVAPLYVNEAYTFHFPNKDFSPAGSNSNNEFVLIYDGANKTLTLPNVQMGSLGVAWLFGPEKVPGGIVFYAEIGETSKDGSSKAIVPEALKYSWSDNYKLDLVAPDLGGKTLHWSGVVVSPNSDNKMDLVGYYSGYGFTGSTSLVKTAAAASTKSVKKVDLMHPEFPIKDGGSYLLK